MSAYSKSEQQAIAALSGYATVSTNLLRLYDESSDDECQQSARLGVHPIRQSRDTQGEFHLLRQLRQDDREFRSYMRMGVSEFDELHRRVHVLITKRSRRPDQLTAEQRLQLTLRFLATGNSFASLAFAFHLAKSTVSEVVHETTEAICMVLTDQVVTPTTAVGWETIADGFSRVWNFPNCIGALDGKHVNIKSPAKSGSVYFNYKGNFSIILLAMCDAFCRFIFIDVGSYGKILQVTENTLMLYF
jgi:hypothetical protein